ncbi:MAG: alpha-glucan family phosphorylase [Chlorobi bacterium]|nr:alpha-glucan family phosphorylase [Chlorobiota bacterium]
MRAIRTISVVNSYPEQIRDLEDLTHNLYWTWSPEIRNFLHSIGPELWNKTNHNPLKTLGSISPDQLQALATDKGFCERYGNALSRLKDYLDQPTWFGTNYAERNDCIAYFSAEFGLHESVPLYSGGLGVLSGDHTKSASDLGLPFIGIGLLYQMGYFRQRLAIDGAQLESYDYNDPSTLPISRVRDANRVPLTVTIDMPQGELTIGVWLMNIGRVRLYLLDTNNAENEIPEYRDITGYLYGGDKETRIMQEIVLGIGGMRMLAALGIEPTVTHCNEGYSAFLLLERSRIAMERWNLSFREAARLTASGSVFTIHTPLPAGHDIFPQEMIEHYLLSYRNQLGLTLDDLMRLGRVNPDDDAEGFSMTVLALRLTSGRNGVSQLHGEVSREMWHEVWPNFSYGETPIIGITNGVHTLSFVADKMRDLFSTYVARDWNQRITDQRIWSQIASIPDEQLWKTKEEMRGEMIEYLRRRLTERRTATYTRSKTGRDMASILDPHALTIGFARRFATYKRATLLFRDSERAYRLFNDPDRPVQLLIAGKAHPKDEEGKKFIREIFSFVRESGLEHRIMFIEDYDIGVARAMVQGCDVWLNTPRRPMEASGTSGMKAAVNGTINLSILDGWFPEGYDGTNGFAIGDEREFVDETYQDEIESRQLYRLLEDEVIPTFYDRDQSGLPKEWIAIQKRTIETMAGHFSSDRMVQEYTERLYIPASDRYRSLSKNNAEGARNLSAWIYHIKGHWDDISFVDVKVTPDQTDHRAGDEITLTAQLSLGRIAPENVRVEAMIGPLDDGEITDGTIHQLDFHHHDNTTATYKGNLPLLLVGQTGFTVRVIPALPTSIAPPDAGLVTWR